MPKELYTASEAAAALGISLDTLRRWDKTGRIRVTRDQRNRRVVAATEVDRLRGDDAGAHISARNRLHGVVLEVKRDGVMAQVDMACGPYRVVSLMSAEAADELDLKPGDPATAVVKATTVMVERA